MSPHLAFRAGLRLLCLAVSLLTAATVSHAQNITKTVVPGGVIDIPNSTGNRWYIMAPANMGGATIARFDGGVAEDVWPSSPNFYPDPTNYSGNRIWSGQYLRVYANSLPVGTVITVPYNTPNPTNNSYTIKVTVQAAPAVTAITLLDANPTAAATVHWGITFSEAITGVTAANFALNNPNGLAGATITGVSGSGTSWTVTASTGTGTGLLGCNWVGHQTESPAVPNTFTGFQYSFQLSPVITADPVGAYIATNTTYALSVTAVMRGGGGMTYQWYLGPYASRSAISGATGSSYTVPATGTVGLRQYSCRVTSSANTSYYTDSGLADINTVAPVQLTTQPSGTIIASGQTATLTVVASGTAPLHYDWYRGAAGDTSNPAGAGSATFTTPALNANTTYWVRVGNNLPAGYNRDSSAATVRVVTSLTGNGPLSTTVGTAFAPAPGFTASDSAGAVVAGLTIGFTAPAAGATGRWAGAATTTAVTNASGVAQTGAFTAGTVAGAYNLTGTYAGVSGTIAATNVPGVVAKLVLATAPGGTASAGVPFSPAPVIQLLDSANNLCTQDSTTVVTATRLAGSGTLQGTTTAPASAGVVTFGNLFATVPSTITVQFTAGAQSVVTGNIAVGPGAPAALVATGGSGQTAFPGTAFLTALQAKLTDVYGNPIPGRSVTFSAPVTGASVTFAAGATANTDAAGIVSVPPTANALSGTYQVTANINPALSGAAVFDLSNYTRLENWRSVHFGSPANSGNGADGAMPFGDGIANLLKYACNLNADGADATVMVAGGTKGLPLVGVDGAGHLTLAFVRRPAATSPGITYTVLFSDDLVGWSANGAATTATEALDAEFERVLVTDSVAPTRRFARLQITNP